MEGPVFTRLEQSDALFDFGLAFRSAFGYQRTVQTETNGISFRSWNAGSRAALAQLVEHIIRNDGVACSSHASGTKKIKHLALDEPPRKNSTHQILTNTNAARSGTLWNVSLPPEFKFGKSTIRRQHTTIGHTLAVAAPLCKLGRVFSCRALFVRSYEAG